MKKFTKIALTLALVLGFSACGAKNNEKAQDSKQEAKTEEKAKPEEKEKSGKKDSGVIKIGVVGEYNDVLKEVIKRYEKGTGKKAELVVFSDYSQPNEALLAGDIDLNAYQHYKFLEEFNQSKGSDLVSIGNTMLAPIAIYSNKIKSLDELKEGDKVALPNDPSNGSRALFHFKKQV